MDNLQNLKSEYNKLSKDLNTEMSRLNNATQRKDYVVMKAAFIRIDPLTDKMYHLLNKIMNLEGIQTEF